LMGPIRTSGGNLYGGSMHQTISRVTTLTMLAASFALAGCKAKDTGATADTTAASSMATHDTSTSAAANGAVSATLSDANIAALLDEVNAGDSTLAAAALPKLTNSGVRDFAKMMMGEHHGLRVKGNQVFKAQKITPELPATDPFKPAVEAETSALSSLSKGPAYDSTYIANEAGIHQAVIDWAGKNPAQNAGLQQYIKDAAPTLQKHLDKAHELQGKLGGGKMS
jgi:putative membrane protein